MCTNVFSSYFENTIPFLLFLRSILFLLESTKFNSQVENNETLNETTKKKENKQTHPFGWRSDSEIKFSKELAKRSGVF